MVDVLMSLDIVNMSYENYIQHAILIAGDSDFIPSSGTQKTHQNIVNSQYVVLKECGHASIFEKPNEIIAIVQDFLRQN